MGMNSAKNVDRIPTVVNFDREGMSNCGVVSSAPAGAKFSFLFLSLSPPPKQLLSWLSLEVFFGNLFIWNLPI